VIAMWSEDAERLALLELLQVRRLKRRKSQERAWRWLSELAWTRRTSQRDVLRLVDDHEADLKTLLDRVWPEWRAAQSRLAAAGLSPTDADWRTLLDRERAGAMPRPMPTRLNRRTATAVVGPHSKASLSETRRQALAEIDLTRDGLVRLRPTPGLALTSGTRALEVDVLVPVLRELVLTERSLRDGTKLDGHRPTALLLVENLGPYLDVAPPDGWLVAHVPGWNTATAQVLLEQVCDIPVVHFGDLDPNGLRIVRHLRYIRADLRWAVPAFWSEYVPARAIRKKWPPELVTREDPVLVQELACRSLWLEQEVIALDPRLRNALLDALPHA